MSEFCQTVWEREELMKRYFHPEIYNLVEGAIPKQMKLGTDLKGK